MLVKNPEWLFLRISLQPHTDKANPWLQACARRADFTRIVTRWLVRYPQMSCYALRDNWYE